MTSIAAPLPGSTALDVDALRAEFPILRTLSRGKPLVYLDSAATSQKPQAVIDAVQHYYAHDNANIHRGVYQLSERATAAWEGARAATARFVGAATDEIVFVRGTTEAINLVANSFFGRGGAAGRTVLVTEMEHHANIVSWQLAGANTVAIPVFDNGELDLAAAERLLDARPALLAVAHVSNALGTINPIRALTAMAQARGVPVLVDGAQAVPHLPVDVVDLGCDFYCFSSHKLFGPTGIGVLWGKAAHLEAMPPYQGGGDMIERVTFDGTSYAPAPRKFEAGTPHIAGAAGLGAAIGWLSAKDRGALERHEADLLEHATAALAEVPGLQIVGTAAEKVAVVAFTLAGGHPHDVASLLDGEGICVRAGHHCTQPLHRRYQLTATVRASFAPYNSHADVDALVRGLIKAQRVLA